MIEITKAFKVAFMKARHPLVARYKEECANLMVKIYFLKLPAYTFWLPSKCCSWFNKVIYSRPSIKWTHKKVMILY